MRDWRAEVRKRLSALPMPPTRVLDIADEVAQHLEDRYDALIASGVPDADAVDQVRSEIEDEEFLKDLVDLFASE